MTTKNLLICGDNLETLRASVPQESVDLAYCDPPFHSKRTHRGRNGSGEFRDTWTWDDAASDGFAQISGGSRYPRKLAALLEGLAPVVGRRSLLAYLVHISLRIAEIHRALKPSGSFFLHCDPAASHYLKLVLDSIFDADGGGFRNEIVWCYSHGGRSKSFFGRKHDIIFFYARSRQHHFDPGAVRVEMRSGKESFGGRLETGEDGRTYRLVYGTRNSQGEVRYYKYYLDQGKTPEDWWVDINSLQASSSERTGYPTQKPEALLERIIQACSREGDTVLDPYCGSGTTLVAAERHGRCWIGIDAAPAAVTLTLQRIGREFGEAVRKRIVVSGAE